MSEALRTRWTEHIAQTLLRPVLIIDEAQETLTAVFNELRVLASKDLDSRQLLCVVFAGDPLLLPADAAAAYRRFSEAGGTTGNSIPADGQWSLIVDGLFVSASPERRPANTPSGLKRPTCWQLVTAARCWRSIAHRG